MFMTRNAFHVLLKVAVKLLQQKMGLKPMSSVTLQQKLKYVTSAVALS